MFSYPQSRIGEGEMGEWGLGAGYSRTDGEPLLSHAGEVGYDHQELVFPWCGGHGSDTGIAEPGSGGGGKESCR